MDVTTAPPSHEALFRQSKPRQDTATRSLSDVEIVTIAALSGGAETWFDAFWYPEAPEAHHGRLREAARLLWDRIAATRMCRVGWRLALGKVFAMTAATLAPGNRRFGFHNKYFGRDRL
jgi:hypothetical protein